MVMTWTGQEIISELHSSTISRSMDVPSEHDSNLGMGFGEEKKLVQQKVEKRVFVE